MNSSNSFNICPRCGNSNALNAKYCSRCGGQLKVPEEPVVCHKCHTRNTPMANFCRNCGTALNVGSETKICPRCGKEISTDKAVCDCGYSFVIYQQTNPSRTANTSNRREEQSSKPAKAKKQKASKSNAVYQTKGGRGWAIVALILLLIFAYYTFAPYQLTNADGEVSATLRPEFLVNFDHGFITPDGGSAAYGYDYIASLIGTIIQIAKGEVAFGDAFNTMTIADLMITIFVLVAAITMLIHLIVCIIRAFTAKRSKASNIYFLVMAIVTTLLIGLIALFHYVTMPEGFLQTCAGWFAIADGATLGYAIYVLPLYFWFFYIYSLCAKAKRLKEQA